MRKSILFWALAALLCAPEARAQAWEVFPGDRVRVSAPAVVPHRLVGDVVVSDRASLLVRTSDLTVVRLDPATIRRVEGSHGHERVRWTLIGAPVGLVLGVVVAAALESPPAPHTPSSDPFAGLISAGVHATLDEMNRAINRSLGGIVGVGLGMAAGAVLAPERWREVIPPWR